MENFKAQQDIKAYSDSVLLRKIKEGDDAAFEEITERYKGLIGSIAARYSAAGFDRSDFMQEGLLALLSACKGYDLEDGKASFRNFAALCISRRFMSVIRSANAKGAIPQDSLVPFEDIELSDNNTHNPEHLLLDRESSEDLLKSLKDKLSPLEMNVLRYYLCGMSYSEIAKHLDSSEKSVDNALQRIRKKLADK